MISSVSLASPSLRATPAPVSSTTIPTYTVSQIAGFVASQVQSLSAATLNAFTGAQLAALNVSQMSAAQVSSLATTTVSDLSLSQAQSLTKTEVAALSAAQVDALGGNLSSFSTTQVQALTNATLNGLAASAYADLPTAKLSTTETAALSASAINHFTASEVGSLSVMALGAAQLSGLSTTTLANFTVTEAQALSKTQVAGLTATNVNALASDLTHLSSVQIQALTTAALNGLAASSYSSLPATSLSNTQLAALTATALDALSTSALAAMSSTQADALSAAQLDAINEGHLQALDLKSLSTGQVSGLTATAVADMSATQLASAVATNVGSLSKAAVASVTATDIAAMSTTQAGEFTVSQQAALSASAMSELGSALGGGIITNDVSSLEQNGSLSYNAMLKILDDASSGGMNAYKFQALTNLAGSLDHANGPSTTAYVQQMFDNVVLGNGANAQYNGGSSTAAALGNLSAKSSQTQVGDLIGKWFLGSDMPSLSGVSDASYEASNLPLYGSSGSPQLSDINQGEIGDCYFLSAVVSTLQQDPSLIKNMIQSNGNNSYSVEFQLNGHADYVTVNNELPTLSGAVDGDGSDLAGANGTTDMWAGLVEKAYAEYVEQPGTTPGESDQHADAYSAINGGSTEGLSAITGQSMSTSQELSKTTTNSYVSSLLTQLQSGLASGQEEMLATGSASKGNLVSSHMYAITAVNATQGTVTLHNPWGANSASGGVAADFTASISQLEAEGVWTFESSGTPVAA
jgi:hypothetical protein